MLTLDSAIIKDDIIINCKYYEIEENRKSNLTKKQEIYLNELLDNRYTYPSFLHDIDQEENFSSAKDLGKELAYDREDSFNRKV